MIQEIAIQARQAAILTAALPTEVKNRALAVIAGALRQQEKRIVAASEQDLTQAQKDHLKPALLKRLKFDAAKLKGTIEGIESLITLAADQAAPPARPAAGPVLSALRVIRNLGLHYVLLPSDDIQNIHKICFGSTKSAGEIVPPLTEKKGTPMKASIWNAVFVVAGFLAMCATVAAEGDSGLPAAAGKVAPPEPFGPVPSARQLKWHEMGMYAFCHFGVDTFTGAEWGSGGEKPEIFHPAEFDGNQIAGAIKAGGFKGIILTCKHHDGFCLWPTKSTPHNISASPYKNGKGDIVREMAEACRQADIKFGVYVSPWDRNHPEYGQPGYVKVYHQQIKELLTGYGPLFEIWFDGANGGDGYYGGAGGTRKIQAATYYDWDTIWDMVRLYQPQAIIYSDVGPDIRWVGNESGYAQDPCWTTYTPHVRDFQPAKTGSPLSRFDAWGFVNYPEGEHGHRDGRYWLPAEVDVSIRPGWFWHQEQNPQVRSPENLMQIYLASVGLGQSMNLNVPPNRRGLVDDNDVASLKAFGEHLRQTFAENLAQGAVLAASEVRGGDADTYGPQKLLDGDPWSAWVTNDHWTSHAASVEITLAGEKAFNLIRLREDVRLGQRVEQAAVDAWDTQAQGGEGDWKELARAESIGACRLWRVPETTASRLRLRVVKSPVAPALSDFGLYREPAFVP